MLSLFQIMLKVMLVLTQKTIKSTFLIVLFRNLFVFMINVVKQLFFTELKVQL